MPKDKKGKNGKNENDEKRDSLLEAKLREETLRLVAIREAKEEERQKRYQYCWDKRLKAEERVEDCKVCCAPDVFYADPRIQSNLWLSVEHDKATQHVQMSFMDVPVPKAKPPPLQNLPIVDLHPVEEKGKDKKGKNGKKGKKGKK